MQTEGIYPVCGGDFLTVITRFLCSLNGEQTVAALSVRQSVRPSQFCPQHISKSIEDNLMKLDTLIKGLKENGRLQKK